MNQQRRLNPQIVHDIAAQLFWLLAESAGVEATSEAVIDSGGRCLVEAPFSTSVLGQYGFDKLSPDERRGACEAIAAEAEAFTLNGENMNGIVYGEDAAEGRAPSAQDVETAHLKVLPKDLSYSGQALEKTGRLCLRHPLPAVVFTNVAPRGEVLEVADTSDALGFHLPMFLSHVATTQLDDNLYVSMGIFHIPVPDSEHGDQWVRAIANSTRFIDGVQFGGAGGVTSVDVTW
ncbi:hypothetical protein P3T20_005073 [Paraburkholderia sp. GAS206C]|uniref:hypothetical protein n=1 Tax=unclassified Paraburkholderia TaxID=2615204 RepID=UPI003D22AF73